ncbi:MAG: glycosyltransferase family 2 protein [Candidatus Hodarchaeales archaeon]|jgi:GT2 family glycosyltransferase
MGSFPSIAIIITTWSNIQDLLECLSSLRKMDYPAFKTIVVDNGSSVGVSEVIYREFKDVEIIRSEKNLGWAGGTNIGIKYALKKGYDWLLLLNDDTVADPSLLRDFAEIIRGEGEDFSIMGVLNLSHNDPTRNLACGGSFIWWRLRLIPLFPTNESIEKASTVEEVDTIAGACMFVKSEAFRKIGLIEPRFFIQFEETEFCVRAKKAGFKVGVAPKLRILHKVGQSTPSPMRDYFFVRNRGYFFARNNKKRYAPLTATLYVLAIIRLTLGYLIHGRIENIFSIFKGFWDFMRIKFVDLEIDQY